MYLPNIPQPNNANAYFIHFEILRCANYRHGDHTAASLFPNHSEFSDRRPRAAVDFRERTDTNIPAFGGIAFDILRRPDFIESGLGGGFPKRFGIVAHGYLNFLDGSIPASVLPRKITETSDGVFSTQINDDLMRMLLDRRCELGVPNSSRITINDITGKFPIATILAADT